MIKDKPGVKSVRFLEFLLVLYISKKNKCRLGSDNRIN